MICKPPSSRHILQGNDGGKVTAGSDKEALIVWWSVLVEVEVIEVRVGQDFAHGSKGDSQIIDTLAAKELVGSNLEVGELKDNTSVGAGRTPMEMSNHGSKHVDVDIETDSLTALFEGEKGIASGWPDSKEGWDSSGGIELGLERLNDLATNASLEEKLRVRVNVDIDVVLILEKVMTMLR